jgi:hypothetical protein
MMHLETLLKIETTLSRDIATVLGWVGAIACLVAYLLLSLKKLKAHGLLYPILNVIGGIGLTYSAIYSDDYPNIIINILWATIALTSFFLNVKKEH